MGAQVIWEAPDTQTESQTGALMWGQEQYSHPQRKHGRARTHLSTSSFISLRTSKQNCTLVTVQLG